MAPYPREEFSVLLSAYTGPAPERGRCAIAKLAQGDPQNLTHFLTHARNDYRDVLWWADIQEQEERRKQT
jgi:hypothetical protein